MTHRLLVALACVCVLLSGCAGVTYRRTSVGEFSGQLDVRWIKPDRFIYMPNPDDPLRFVTSDRRAIVAGTMYTDGGSIPRLFWGVPGYSPWGYAPAYIVHDWLFAAHHCALPAYADVTFDDSARVLAEAIKTLMETDLAPRDATTLWAIHAAVQTPIAKKLWDAPDHCDRPAHPAAESQPIGELVLRIDVRKPR